MRRRTGYPSLALLTISIPTITFLTHPRYNGIMADISSTLIATNLIPTPRLASANLGNTSITQTADGFTITTNKTYTGAGDDHNLYPQNVVAGVTYHLHAETDDVLTTTLPDASIFADYGFSVGGSGVPNTRLSSPSVIDVDLQPKEGIYRIAFKCGMTAGDHVTWRRLGLYTATDWQAMHALNPPVNWFSGDAISTS